MAKKSISFTAELENKYTFKLNNDLKMEVEEILEGKTGIIVSVHRKVGNKIITYEKSYLQRVMLDNNNCKNIFPNSYDDWMFYYLLCNAFATRCDDNGSNDYGTIRFVFDDGIATIYVNCIDANDLSHVFDIQLQQIDESDYEPVMTNNVNCYRNTINTNYIETDIQLDYDENDDALTITTFFKSNMFKKKFDKQNANVGSFKDIFNTMKQRLFEKRDNPFQETNTIKCGCYATGNGQICDVEVVLNESYRIAFILPKINE
jgi:hypothetical protein